MKVFFISAKSTPKVLSSEKNDSSSQSNKNKSYKKPKRPCPYCGKFQAKLTRHLQYRHKDEKDVQEAMKLPNKQKSSSFSDLKKRGIFLYNTQRVKDTKEKEAILLRERNQGSHELMLCGFCQGFFAKTYMWHHKQSCNNAASSVSSSQSLPVSVLKIFPEDKVDSFTSEILAKFRGNDIGNLCREDKLINLYGRKQWAKNIKEDKKPVMSDIRRLASLILKCRCLTGNANFSGEDLLKRKNVNTVTEAIGLLGSDCENEKPSLKLGLGYMLKTCCKIMKGTYLVEKKDEEAQETDIFSSILELNWGILFSKAVGIIEKKRQEKLRSPCEMPLEDVLKLNKFNKEKIQEMMDDDYMIWTNYEFNRLRALLVCRLTMYNARRGGEPT